MNEILVLFERAISAAIGRPIGPDENYFEAGLTSAGLVRLHQACARGPADPFPVTALFTYPNLRALGRYLAEGEAAGPATPGRGVDGDRLRRVGAARRRLRERNRSGSERP